MPQQPFGTAEHAPQSRYILPTFTERTSYGFKELSPYTKLFEERIIFLGVQIDDASADDVMAQLLCLEQMDPDRDISIYINSPGWLVHRADRDLRLHAVHPPGDPDRLPRPGRLGRGRPAGRRHPGKRLALPNSRILIHQPYSEGGGQSSDIEIQASEIMRMRALLETFISRHSGRSIEQVKEDIERDKILTADEAIEYGLVDEVIRSRKLSAVPAPKAAETT